METPKLRPYQEEDVQFITQFKTAGIFNEQRTGKTPTSLACIKAYGLENEKILIVSTVSSKYIWQQEFEKWVGKPCSVVEGTPKKKLDVIKNWTNGLVISLDTLKETQSSSGYLPEVLKKKPSMVILDEAHHIKNTQTRAFQSISKLKSVPYRLALTGTPAYGKPCDIFSLLNFLFPSEFGSKYAFLDKYFEPEFIQIWNNGHPRIIKEYNKFLPNMETELQTFLNKHCTQRKRIDVMPWLPEKDKQIIKLPLTKEQSKYLKDLSEVFETEDLIVQGILDRLIRYRQICLDPSLVALKGCSPKTEYLLNFISENPETPLIIFSNFTAYLWKLHDIFHTKGIKHAMIIGDVDAKTRSKYQEDFQAGKFNVFLINIQAGKEALTLDRAEAIIFTDTFPPIGAIEQAEDRFIATTEARKDKPHTIYYLVMENSFDETILELLQQRKTETEVINNFKAQLKYKEEGL